MYLKIGISHFGARRLAFKNDFCLACKSEELSARTRTFAFLNIFWIPVFPLGVWRRWLCVACGSRPHVTTRTRLGFKIAGIFVLALMSWAAWAAPVSPGDENASRMFRVVVPLLCVAMVVWTVRHDPGPNLKKRLEALDTCDVEECPFCYVRLIDRSGRWTCSSCGVVRK